MSSKGTSSRSRLASTRDARRLRLYAERLEDRLLLDARLVADINQIPLARGSFPQDFIQRNELVLFTADTSAGRELWRTDGTAAGTQQIIDLQPGLASTAYSDFILVGEFLYFQVMIEDRIGRSINELWRTDGTHEGTTRFFGEFTPDNLVLLNGNLYAGRRDSSAILEISPDGESFDILPAPGLGFDGIANLTAFSESLFFSAETYVQTTDERIDRGTEIWVSDLTRAGTRMLKDIAPGRFSSHPSHLFATGDTLFFFTGVQGTIPQLWKTDGSPDGTLPIASFPRLPMAGMTESNGLLYFVIDDGEHGQELWRSDGTEDGTFLVKDIRDGPAGSTPIELVNFNDTLFFTADDGVAGSELWASDGTAAGTVLFKDIRDGPSGSGPGDFTIFDGRLFFSAADEEHGLELWKTDGTTAGTELALDLIDGPASSLPTNIRAAGNQLYFAAQGTPTEGFEPWRSDGTLAGTVSLGNLAVDGTDGSLPRAVTRIGETIYFVASDGESGHELWKTDGTAAGTALVKDIAPGPASADIGEMWDIDGTLYLSASDGVHGIELWTSDGTAEGTRLVKDIEPGFGAAAPTDLIKVSDVIYFRAYDSVHGEELWRTDGTAAGTAIVRDINPGIDGSDPRELTNLDGHLFFAANDGNRNEIWRSDGTNTGTEVAADTTDRFPVFSPNVGSLVALNGELFFLAELQLYKTTGTPDSTVQLGGVGNYMVPYGDNLLLLFRTPRTSGSILEFDTQLAEVPQDEWLDFPDFYENDPQFTVVAERLFFNANGVGGANIGDVEMWSYDPRNQDLRLVVGDNINPAGSPEPKEFSIHNDLIFFVATGAGIGTEVWATNGTEVNTFPVADIAPGPPHSLPSQLTFLDDTLFVRGDDGVAGTELWAIDLLPVVRFRETALSVFEGTAGNVTEIGAVTITLTRLGNISVPLNVRIETVGGSATGSSVGADHDFVDTPLNVTFAAHQTEAMVTLPIVKDNLTEIDETIDLAITNVNGGHIGAHFELTVTLFNDDLPGDLDFDHDLDLADLDALGFAIVFGPPPDAFSFYDLNRDGALNPADVDTWLALAGAENLPSGQPYLRGDADLNGVVDFSDYGILRDHLFSTAPFWSRGDFNADGVIDGSDFNNWNSNKFSNVAGENAAHGRPPRAPLARHAVIVLAHSSRTNAAERISAADKISGHDRLADNDTVRRDCLIWGEYALRTISRYLPFRNAEQVKNNHHKSDQPIPASLEPMRASLVDALLSAK